MTKIFDMLPGWVWALIVAGFVLHSCGQSNKIDAGKLALSEQKTLTKDAEGKLTARVAAEAQVVAASVQKARLEEQAKFALLQEKTNALRKQNAAARADLAAANDRLRDPIAAAAAGYGCRNVPQGGTAAGGVDAGAQAQFERAGRALTDEILQLLTEGDEAIRERQLLQELRPGATKQ